MNAFQPAVCRLPVLRADVERRGTCAAAARSTAPVVYRDDHGAFEAVRKKFNDAGITIFAYTVNYNAQYSDDEIAASFRHGKTLGTNIIASSTTVSMAKRIVPFAEKAK